MMKLTGAGMQFGQEALMQLHGHDAHAADPEGAALGVLRHLVLIVGILGSIEWC